MEDVSFRKRQLEESLKSSERKLENLRESLEKSDQLTTNMMGILDSFTVRLKKLDDTIVPVYKQTKELTQLQENVDKSLVQLDKVIGYHHVADDVETKIQVGPGGDVESYIKVLERLKMALVFFHSNNPASVELTRLHDYFDQGLDTLQRDFMNLMKNSSRPVALPLLNDIAACEDIEDLPPLEHLPARTISELRATAEYLISQSGGAMVGGNVQNKDILLVYSQLRSNQLGRSLNTFKEANSSSLLQPSQYENLMFHLLLKEVVVRPSHQLVSEGGVVSISSELSVGSSEEGLDGCGYIMAATTVFLRLIEGEVRLMRQVIPKPHQSRVLRDLTAQPIEFFMKEVEMLHQHVVKSLSYNDFPVAISVFRLVRHVQGLLPEYKTALYGLDGSPYSRFEDIVKQFQKVNHKALEDYVAHIKGNPEKQSNLPKDGTVHELTSHTMWFVEHLLDYSRNVGEVIFGESSFGVVSDADRRKSLGHYLTRVVDALNLNMESKARSYEHPQLASLFLLNNYHFIHKTFTRNEEMQRLLEEAYGDVEQNYINSITTHLRNYQRCFGKAIGFLGHEVSASAGAGGPDKLSKAAKQTIKDKYKGFNTEIEELCRVQQHWSIPDSQLRARVRTENVELVGPLYAEFHRVYSEFPFTKNPEKYLKFTPESLEETLETFFDGGA
ncbi:Exocyst complex component 7 [Geodia barretti]|uniref:Exocyst complex component 7 n=1 Tax=Geodia barretti TaxID=519541 RepID=A0AA35RUI5_GEOBA|nr:Exocyst complex component 7 [Geodia barretti]